MLAERVAHGLEALIELGWLAAVIAVPVYFNVDDVRAFEPDKAILLRDIAAVLLPLALLHAALRFLPNILTPAGSRRSQFLPRRTSGKHAPAGTQRHPSRSSRHPLRWARREATSASGSGSLVLQMKPPLRAIIHVLRQRATLASMLALAAVTLAATATSILPAVSWHGSYARAQGALTTLAYLVLALLVVGLLRRPRQAERLATAIALSGVAPAAYGWVQHLGRDPLPWQQPDLAVRVPGTMGNPIFLGGLLVMALPLALYRLALALRSSPPAVDSPAVDPTPGLHRLPAVLVWALVVLVEGGGLLFTKSRGPFAGLLVALVIFGLGLGWAWDLRHLRRATLAVCALAVVALLGANLLGSGALGPIREGSSLRLVQWTPRASGTSEVRLEIWGPALKLVTQRPLLGCGPDALLWCYYPVYPTALRHIEAPNAVPDRTHNMLLDAAVETGLLGLAALLALLAVTARTLGQLVGRAADPARRALAAALLAALAGHLAEGFVGIAVVATTLLTWLIAALAGSLAGMESAEVPMPASVPPVQGDDYGRVARGGGSRPGNLLRSKQPYPRGQDGRSTPVIPGTGFGQVLHRQRPIFGALCALGLWVATGIACWLAWATLADGARATAADTAARQGAGLEQVALGNSGQAPMPAGLAPRPGLALRQFAAAADYQATAIRIAPDREEYLLDAGNTLVAWAQAAATTGGPAAAQAPDLYVRALLDFGRAARLNPYNPDHLRNTGKAYERWAGLGHDPNQPSTWNRQLLARAAQAFARAALLAPRHPDPLTSWAQVALWQGQSRQALDLLRRALVLDPHDGDAYRLRATVELALGKRVPAMADWRLALADPTAGHAGETASQLALAEATWARARCPAVRDARLALTEPDTPNPTLMREIVQVDSARCPGW